MKSIIAEKSNKLNVPLFWEDIAIWFFLEEKKGLPIIIKKMDDWIKQRNEQILADLN